MRISRTADATVSAYAAAAKAAWAKPVAQTSTPAQLVKARPPHAHAVNMRTKAPANKRGAFGPVLLSLMMTIPLIKPQ